MCDFLRKTFRRFISWCCMRGEDENNFGRQQCIIAESVEMHPIARERDSIFENVELPELPITSFEEVQSRKSSEDNSEGLKFKKPPKSVLIRGFHEQKSDEEKPGRKSLYRQSTRYTGDSDQD